MMMLMSKMTIETMEDEIKDCQIWEEGSDGSKVGRQELRMYQWKEDRTAVVAEGSAAGIHHTNHFWRIGLRSWKIG